MLAAAGYPNTLSLPTVCRLPVATGLPQKKRTRMIEEHLLLYNSSSVDGMGALAQGLARRPHPGLRRMINSAYERCGSPR